MQGHCRLLFCTIVGLVLAVAARQPAAAQVAFAAAASSAAGSWPSAVAVADFNGDGRPDLVVANHDSDNVSVFRNAMAPGAATPTFGSAVNFTVGSGPASVAVADINGDGKPDLLVANSGSNNASVLLDTTAPGAATPSFAAAVNFTVGTDPSGIAAADLNGDGKMDLVVANRGSDTVSVLRNTTTPGATTPTFATAVSIAAGTSPASVAAADANGDGRPDLLVANSGSNNVSVLRNNMAAGATTPVFIAAVNFAAGSSPSSVAAVDLNGDGRPDLLVANTDSDDVSVLVNSAAPGGAASFAAAVDFAAGTEPSAAAAADVNGDGRADLLVSNSGSNDLAVRLNVTTPGATTPSFAAAFSFATGTSPSSVAVADLNGDGRPDLATADEVSNDVAVLLNATVVFGRSAAGFSTASAFSLGGSADPSAVALADVNFDGKRDLLVADWNGGGTGAVDIRLNTTAAGATTPTFGTTSTFTTGNYPSSVAAADFNGDGKPDLLLADQSTSDVSVLLNTTTPGGAGLTFASAASFSVGSDAIFAAAADINGDGRPDVVSTAGTDGVSVLLNNTTPGAATPAFRVATSFTAGTTPFSVAVADVNGDGKPDIVAANYDSDDVSVLRNTTTPGATTPSFAGAVNFPVGTNPRLVALADVNGDGRPDLLVANEGSNDVSVLPNTTTPGSSAPSFGTAVSFSAGNGPRWLAAVDLNGDGRPDLLVANWTSRTVSVLGNITSPGGSAPAFSAATSLAAGTDPRSVAAADLNSDGKPDVVAANNGSGNVSVFLGLRTANLSITKSDGVATVAAGGTTTYTITAANPEGADTVTGAAVVDSFPAALTCTWSCPPSTGGTCAASGSGNLSDATARLVAGGSVAYTAACSVSLAATGTISNTAVVTAPSGVTDPSSGNNSATDTDTVVQQADLAIGLDDGVATAAPGGQVIYSITATNPGPSNAPGSTVVDTFPAALTCTWICLGAGGGTCAASGSGSVNDLVSLPAGGSVTYTATCVVSIAATGTLSNSATVFPPGGVTDADLGNNTATDSDTLVPQADLAITKSDGTAVATLGGQVTYTIVASNAGPSNAPGSTVADLFPAALSCSTTCLAAGGGSCTAGPFTTPIQDTVNLPAGASVTYTSVCNVSAAATGSIDNTATVSSPAGVGDPVAGNNSATDSDGLQGSELFSADFESGDLSGWTSWSP